MALDRWLSPLFDIARSLTQDSARTPGSIRPASASVRPAAPEPVAVAEAAPVALAEPAPAPVALAEPAPAPVALAEPAPAPVALAEAVADEDEATDDGAEPEPAAAPLVSRAMARLLAAQGHGRRAAAMYEALLQAKPDDEALRAESVAALTATRRPRPNRRSLDEGLAGEDEIVAVRASAQDLLLSWQVGEGRLARGRKLLPHAQDVTVRVVVFRRSPDFRVEREERERVVEVAGEWLVRDVPSDAWVTASVGLRRDGDFVSLAHSAAARAS